MLIPHPPNVSIGSNPFKLKLLEFKYAESFEDSFNRKLMLRAIATNLLSNIFSVNPFFVLISYHSIFAQALYDVINLFPFLVNSKDLSGSMINIKHPQS